MKKNKILLFVALVLIIVAAILLFSSRKGTFGRGTSNFAVDDTASVTKIFMVDKNNRSILLKRIDSTRWTVNDKFTARKTGVDMLLETVKNITPRSPVPRKGHNTVIKIMAAKSIKVEIYQNTHRINLFGWIRLFPREKCTKTYYVGHPTQDNMGTFMLMEKSSTPFIVHILGFRGFVASRYSTNIEEWRDFTVFSTKFSQVKSVDTEFTGAPGSSFTMISEKSRIRLIRKENNEEMKRYDTLKVLNFLNSFADVKFEALLNKLDKKFVDSIKTSQPFVIVKLKDIKGQEFRIKVFHKENSEGKFDAFGTPYPYDVDKAYALVNKDQDFVLIQYFVFDKILRPLEFYLPQEVIAVEPE